MSQTPIGISILATCRQAAATVTDHDEGRSPFRAKLSQIYTGILRSDLALHTAQQADRLFTTLMTLNRADDWAVRKFANSWQETHVSSDLVGLLALRLHADGAHAAAGDMMKVIAEDIGSEGRPHRELFVTFADAICTPPDSWRSASENTVPACRAFRCYLKKSRTKADLEVGVLTTAASEIWNVGEYATLSEKFPDWLQTNMGLSPSEAKRANAYTAVHAGNTELHHFQVAIEAWDKLSHHQGKAQDPETAGEAMRRYLLELGQAYEGLADCLEDERAQCRRKSAARLGASLLTYDAISA